jgi:DNA-binding transcriptional MerR regulator
MNNLTISQLAKHAGVNVETVRYYERRGLLPAPQRSASCYRHYSQDDVAYLRFIRRAQTLGFSLKEIVELLALRVASETTCEDIRVYPD